MAADESVSERELELAASDVRSHPQREPLALLAFDVLGRQAQAPASRGNKPLVRRRAKKHAVSRRSADTSLGNVLVVLEKGPKDASERALLAAHVVRGLGIELGRAESDSQRRGVLHSFVERAHWWEGTLGLPVYACVERVLPDEDVGAVWQAVAQATEEAGDAPETMSGPRRAAQAIRVTALAEATHATARRALEHLASQAEDPFTRAAAAGVLGRVSHDAAAPPRAAEHEEAGLRVEGSLRSLPRTRAVQVLRWFSGWALLAWLGRALAGLTGWKRQGTWELDGNVIRIKMRVTWLGHVIRESEETVAVGSLLAGTRQIRYPWMHLLVGIMATAIGIVIGTFFFQDALRSGQRVFLWVGAGIILSSAGLDFLLDALWSGRRRRVVLELRVRQQGRLCLRSVPLEHADRFLERLAARFPEPEGA